MFSSKSSGTYSKKQAKEQVCLYLWDNAINNENKDENEK